MGDGLNQIIETADDYSYIVNGKKVTINRGERFVRLNQLNQRWVLVHPLVGDQRKLLLPLRIIYPVASDDTQCRTIAPNKIADLSFIQSEMNKRSSNPSLNDGHDDDQNNCVMNTLPVSASSLDHIPMAESINPTEHASSLLATDSNSSIKVVHSFCHPDSQATVDKCSALSADCHSVSPSADHVEVRPRSTFLMEHVLTQEDSSTSEPGPNASLHWRRQIDNGVEVFVNTQTDEKWAPAVDKTGKTYYYEISTRQSVWELEDFQANEDDDQPTALSPDSDSPSCTVPTSVHPDEAGDQSFDSWSSDGESSVVSPGTGPNGQLTKHSSIGEDPSVSCRPTPTPRSSVGKNALRLGRLNTGSLSGLKSTSSSTSKSPTSREDELNSPADSPDGRFNVRQIGKEHISGPEQNKLTNFERRGWVNRTKCLDQGRPVSKKWSEALMVLSGPWLFLYRDAKAATPKSNYPQGKPEARFHVQQLIVSDVTGDEAPDKRRFKLECEGSNGSQGAYLIEVPAKVFDSWKAAFRYAKELLNDEDRLTSHLARNTIRNLSRPPSKLDTSLVSKMRDFFRTRPSAESLRARGILKNEPVFASTLVQICEQENSEVPRFIVCVIRAIEARGLDHLGLYRISANASEVQKLRCCVNQYNYSLNSEKWSLNVLAGGLKLFFRELKEPLFTYDLYPKLVKLFSTKLDDGVTLSVMRELIASMPTPHVATSRVLFHHLYRVLQHSDVNQMHAPKLAIVFGPSLVRSDTEVAHLGMLTAVQAPCVDFCLKHTVDLFGPVAPPPVVA